MRQFLRLGLAAAMALAVPGAGAETAKPEPEPLILAQGLDINDLLKGGSGTAQPERDRQPSRAMDATDLLRGTPAPARPEADTPLPVAAVPSARAFPASALAGTWQGIGPYCETRRLSFAASGQGFEGRAPERAGLTTSFKVLPGTPLKGAPDPDQADSYRFYVQRYAATLTRSDAQGKAVDLIEDWPVHLEVARAADGPGYELRILEPVTICLFARPDEGDN